MTYTQLENIGTIDIQSVMNFPNLDTPLYYPMMLFVIFMIFSLGTFFRELKREGRANLLSSFAVGGYVTTIIAFLLSVLEVLQREMVVAVLVISLVFKVIYLLTNRN